MTKFKRLKEKYPKFIYDSYSYDYKNRSVIIRFKFLIPPDITFTPLVIIRNVTESKFKDLNKESLNNLIFNLGLIEMLSYWKSTCSPTILIKAGNLKDTQISWWENLIIKSMGQYFYENKINFKEDNFLQILCKKNNKKSKLAKTIGKKILVLVGGGKDSAVTLKIITKNFDDTGMAILKSVNVANSNIGPSLDLIKQIKGKETIIVERVIDPNLLKLNSKGYLNGHTPFSAYLAFLFTLTGYLFGYRYVVVSNERSSDEGNTRYLGEIINHQYSKTYEFEKLFREYNFRYLSDIEYFSFLRPLYDIQIAKIFSKYSELFRLIRSCNVGLERGAWCLKCPKCVSTFILLYPFMGDKTEEIFSKNLYKDTSLKPLITKLISFNQVKPFECVGMREELKIALNFQKNQKTFHKLLQEWGENNFLPVDFEKYLRKELYE